MDISTVELRILKNKLTGPYLTNLIAKSGVSKYRIAKDCGLTPQTLINWERRNIKPSDENAIVVGRYLGLIEAKAVQKEKIKEELDALVKKVDALE